MDLDTVGFIVHGITKTQHPEAIRATTVWFEVLSEPRQPPEQQTWSEFAIELNPYRNLKSKILSGQNDSQSEILTGIHVSDLYCTEDLSDWR